MKDKENTYHALQPLFRCLSQDYINHTISYFIDDIHVVNAVNVVQKNEHFYISANFCFIFQEAMLQFP